MDTKQKYSILVVDDENANLLVLNQILSSEYSVYTAKSGEQALRLAAENKPELILLDIIMPDMNGFEVLTKLKESPQTANIPVIFITGLDNANDEEKGFELGAADYITKPFKSVVVMARVKTQMKNTALIHMIEDDFVRVSSIAEGSPQLMLYINAQGKIEYLNPGTVALSGYTREEIIDGGLTLILDADNLRRLNEEILPASSGGHLSFEMPVKRKDGEIRSFSFSAFAAQLYNGETGIGITAWDDTELKRMQQEIAQALVQAKYYNKAKSDFLSRMSHEMRTPMNAIIGMTAITKTAKEESRRIYCLDKIEDASRHLLDLINDALDMAEIDIGNFDLIPQSFNFNKMAEQIIARTASMAEQKKQKFTSAVDPAIPVLLIADERRLKQVLMNLLSNAVKFTPKEGAVYFSAFKVSSSEDTCVIHFEVKDTGVGVSDEQKKHIWDAFEQADNSITRTYGGIGLGLAITKRIVEMMDGTIEVVSEPGKGSLFICTLKLKVDAASLAGGAAAGAASPVSLEGRHILVVDDVEMNREIIFAILEDTGAILEGAQNGEEAVELYLKNTYDLILMDLHMPEMDGFEATRRIRASGIKGSDRIPIIAVTADTGGDMIFRCFETGMNSHIGKPVEMETLVSLIAQNLQKS
ncbi:ATP-binding response regulator [Leadbettera azotonutricia]|uniref:histidine kinase n=1 Tax=Leadbettera azotonutricia (strain ATCC BAA-888 / DSM 13862 / ZAS-9) TaxID=545695 RepID=F5Y6Y1_LEAAZ|nr:response regulator [Leadbettera azotonutricia]AEF80360.1 response regulator receiver sensor hybrid histidine kinase [Leadbettera azotonutricia ZAS-9]